MSQNARTTLYLRIMKTTNIWAKFKAIPYWVFLALFLASGSVSIAALRHNNQQMVKLRSALYAADQSGGNVNAALNNLRGYVYGHMNTNLSSGGNTIKPPIQLKYTYQRLVSAEQARVDAAVAQLYQDGHNYCQAQSSESSAVANHLTCFQDYVNSHSVKANAIPVGLYEFDFASPTWSPDLAGWSLVISAVLLVVSTLSFAADKLTKTRN